MRSFLLGTINSLSLQIRIAGPVTVPSSTQVVDNIEVAGRAGTLTRVSGWQDVTITIPLIFLGLQKLANYRKLAHQATVATTITLSHDGGRFRKLKHAYLSPLETDGPGWARAELTAICQPFAYYPTAKPTLNTTGSTVVANPGLIQAAPTLTLTGTGTLKFTLNGTTYTVNSPSGSLVLDSELMTAYTGSTAQLNAMSGNFPMLKPGNNTFTLPADSGITAWALEVNWRDP